MRRILATNAETAFGCDHGLDRIRGYGDFARQVPVRPYEQLQPYVERVIRGEVSALLGRGQRVLMFALTSGSTDQPKYVPITSAFLRQQRRGWNVLGIKALLDHPEGFLRPILQVVSPMDERRTERGVPCGSISGLLAGTAKRLARRYYVNPPATGAIDDPQARYYAIMRFAVPHDVSWIVTASPATPVKLARCAATHAERLIRDIHDGTLHPPGHVAPEALDALRRGTVPQPEVARRLSRLAQARGELLPRDYWKPAFLANWTGGTLGLHLRDFPHYFGDTPVRDIGLLATEGRVTIPLEDRTPAGVLDAAGAFFEFADADADPAAQSVLHRCHELAVGREYRVIMTTWAGFYRYDLEDRVVVRGYLGQAPILEFLHRGTRVSSVTGEKLTEWQATTAFDRCVGEMPRSGTSFVLAPVWGNPPHYRLHVEADVDDSFRLGERMDRELRTLNIEYASKRSSERLGPVEVNLLPRGTMESLDIARQTRRGSANEQFKHQYLYTRPGEDDALPRLAESPVRKTECVGKESESESVA